mmetsp:Transcript_14037/g.19524  ORF Transcript_14037/g.19524 Transcript_14037/m.19524 type:complete len:252 (+) Transcript_14037:146-901(+)
MQEEEEFLINIKQFGKKNKRYLYLIFNSKDGLCWKTHCSKKKIQDYESQIATGSGSLQAKFIVPPVDVIRLDLKEMINRRAEWKNILCFPDTETRKNIGRKYGQLCKHVLPVSEYSPVLMELVCAWYCGAINCMFCLPSTVSFIVKHLSNRFTIFANLSTSHNRTSAISATQNYASKLCVKFKVCQMISNPIFDWLISSKSVQSTHNQAPNSYTFAYCTSYRLHNTFSDLVLMRYPSHQNTVAQILLVLVI